jgi:hypothetical protein
MHNVNLTKYKRTFPGEFVYNTVNNNPVNIATQTCISEHPRVPLNHTSKDY